MKKKSGEMPSREGKEEEGGKGGEERGGGGAVRTVLQR
jgi:hypothetical protein